MIKGTRVARGLHADYEEWLEKLAPHEPISRYHHNRTGEASPEWSRRNDGDAHLKRQVMGREVVVAITDGRWDDSTELVEVFGPWEQIFWASRIGWHASLDGRRRKRVLVKIIGE